MAHQFLPYIVPLLLIGLVLRRTTRARTINPGRMWIAPVIYGALAVSALLAGPFPGLLFLAIFIVAVLAGAGLGYFRAIHQTLTVDPETGKVTSQPTTIGAILVLVLFAVRFGIKSAFPDLSNHAHASNDVTQGANALLLFTVAMLIAQAVFLRNRTRPLLEAHAAASSATPN